MYRQESGRLLAGQHRRQLRLRRTRWRIQRPPPRRNPPHSTVAATSIVSAGRVDANGARRRPPTRRGDRHDERAGCQRARHAHLGWQQHRLLPSPLVVNANRLLIASINPPTPGLRLASSPRAGRRCWMCHVTGAGVFSQWRRNEHNPSRPPSSLRPAGSRAAMQPNAARLGADGLASATQAAPPASRAPPPAIRWKAMAVPRYSNPTISGAARTFTLSFDSPSNGS